MEFDNHERKAIEKALNHWQQQGRISAEQAEDLRQHIETRKPEQQIARYFFIIALSCTLMAFAAIFIDEKLLERLRVYFDLGYLTISVLMAAIASAWLYYLRKKHDTLRTISYEIYLVLGALAALTSLVYLCKVTGFGDSYSLFLWWAAILLIFLSIFFRSKALWIGALAAFMGWYGAFSYTFSTDHLFLGMNYPLRFAVFGLLLTAFSWFQSKIPRLIEMQRLTYMAGLIIFFTGLWGVSIFGNYHGWEEWMKVRQTQVMVYGFVFGVAALLALYLGIRCRDDTARDLGILFLLINFYSRYFEFFWNSMHKGLFFLFLAVSFWFIGRYIERRRKKGKDA